MDFIQHHTSLVLTIVRALSRQVEAIDPNRKNAGALLDNFFDELTVALEAAEELKGFARAFRRGKKGAASDLRNAAADFAPFATFMKTADKSFSGEFPQSDVDTFSKSVADDCTEIIRSGGVKAMEQPPISDLEMRDATPEEISRYKWTLLVVLYAIEFGLLYGTVVTIWNLVRALGGISFKDPERIGSEIGGAVLVAMTLPGFQRLLRHILQRAQVATVFDGHVDKGKEHIEMIATGILGGEAIHMGIKAGMAIAGNDPDKVKYAMFLGNFMAFFAAGLINEAGQMAIGRKLVVGPAGEPFPSNAIDAVKAFGRHYIDMDILVYERLVHCLYWGCYEVYGGGLPLLAKGDVGKEMALAGGLWLFVSGYKVSFYWVGRLRARRAVDA